MSNLVSPTSSSELQGESRVICCLAGYVRRVSRGLSIRCSAPSRRDVEVLRSLVECHNSVRYRLGAHCGCESGRSEEVEHHQHRAPGRGRHSHQGEGIGRIWKRGTVILGGGQGLLHQGLVRTLERLECHCVLRQGDEGGQQRLHGDDVGTRAICFQRPQPGGAGHHELGAHGDCRNSRERQDVRGFGWRCRTIQRYGIGLLNQFDLRLFECEHCDDLHRHRDQDGECRLQVGDVEGCELHIRCINAGGLADLRDSGRGDHDLGRQYRHDVAPRRHGERQAVVHRRLLLAGRPLELQLRDPGLDHHRALAGAGFLRSGSGQPDGDPADALRRH